MQHRRVTRVPAVGPWQLTGVEKKKIGLELEHQFSCTYLVLLLADFRTKGGAEQIMSLLITDFLFILFSMNSFVKFNR